MCEILPRQEPGPFRFWARTQSGLVGQSGGVAQRQKRDFRQAHRSAFRYGANPCAEPAQGNSKRSLLETLAESWKTACYSGVFLPHPVAVNAHDFEVIEMGAEPAAIATPHTTHRHPSTVVTGTFEKAPRTMAIFRRDEVSRKPVSRSRLESLECCRPTAETIISKHQRPLGIHFCKGTTSQRPHDPNAVSAETSLSQIWQIVIHSSLSN